MFSTKLAYYIAWIGLLAFGFLAWYFSSKGKQEERKMLIQQGGNVEELYKKINRRRQLWWLKIAIVVIGLGVSFVFIGILISLHMTPPDAVFPGIFCIGIGSSMIIAHQVGKKDDDN